jgi:two-component system, OmpR family, sensor kinase
MLIKTRILLALVVIFTVALAAIGFATVTLTRDQMLDRVDRELAQSFGSIDASTFDNQDPDSTSYWSRSVAILLFNNLGDLVAWSPSGYIGEPDPLPDLIGRQIALRSGKFTTVGSAGDEEDTDFRVLVRPVTQGGYIATAIPLDAMDETLTSLITVIALTSVAVLFAVVVFTWIAIQRGLLPIDDMIHTAEAIAAGDLTQRIVIEDSSNEVGKLGISLNEMLTRIETSFRAREQSEHRLRQFVADASHELRTPLTSIRGYAELFRSGAASSPEALSRVMHRIESEGQRMSRLVNDMLQLARLDQPQTSEPQPVDLSPIIDNAVMDANAADAETVIRVHQPAHAFVLGSADGLKQVFDNLLANVRTHAGNGSMATITVALGPKKTRIDIADNGAGIPKDQAAHAFDRFYRADQSRSSAKGGVGLGLSIVEAIVTGFGGTISLTSELGAGTTVHIVLQSAPRLPSG